MKLPDMFNFSRQTPDIHKYDRPISNITKLNKFLEYAARAYTNKHVLPTINSSEAVRVTFGVSLVRIVDLYEKEQSITTTLWKRHVSYT